MSWNAGEGPTHNKARKRHICEVCGGSIMPREEQVTWTAVETNDGWARMHVHPVCYTYSKNWTQEDWECSLPGDTSMEEILNESRRALTV